MVISHTNIFLMTKEKKLVVNSFIQEATPDQLIKFNTNAIARYEQQSLQVIDDYFHLTDASNPIECIGQMQEVFLASKQYKSLKKKQKFNLHVTLKELILMLNKSQELFNLKQSSEDFVEILTTKIN